MHEEVNFSKIVSLTKRYYWMYDSPIGRPYMVHIPYVQFSKHKLPGFYEVHLQDERDTIIRVHDYYTALSYVLKDHLK